MSIWGTLASKSTLKCIQTIQNTCLRCIEPKLWPEESNKKHKILKVEDLIKLEQYKLGYKACNKLLPTRLLTCLFTDSKDRSLKKSHGYNTRYKEIPNVPVMSSLKYRKSFMYMCMKEYTAATKLDNGKQSKKAALKHYKDSLLSKY